MSEQFIEVTIAPDGKLTVEGKGFAGSDCEKATQALQKALGRTVSDHRTEEFYEERKQKASL